MGEDLDPNQTANFIPTDEELDEGGRRFADPLLTEDELVALTRDDKGITLVPQHQYEDLEEFISKHNNFYVQFDLYKNGGLSGPLYRRRKVFQRMVALHPDLVSRLVGEFREYRIRIENETDDLDYSDEMKRDLYDAYQIMSGLIDINDKYVVDPDTGKLDEY